MLLTAANNAIFYFFHCSFNCQMSPLALSPSSFCSSLICCAALFIRCLLQQLLLKSMLHHFACSKLCFCFLVAFFTCKQHNIEKLPSFYSITFYCILTKRIVWCLPKFVHCCCGSSNLTLPRIGLSLAQVADVAWQLWATQWSLAFR